MKQIKDLQIGDEVVISPKGYREPYRFGKVEKITATQITIDGTRYNKRDGVKIGDGGKSIWDSESREYIQFNYASSLMTVEEAKKHNVKIEYDFACLSLSRKIFDTPLNTLRKLPLETLQEVANKLGLIENTRF